MHQRTEYYAIPNKNRGLEKEGLYHYLSLLLTK